MNSVFFIFPPHFFNKFNKYIFLIILFLFFFLSAKMKEDEKVPQKFPEIKRVEKIQKVTINGRIINYQLIFDCMPVKTDSLPNYSGRMCYNAYLLDNQDPSRPVSFFFNGGPGAASVYLNFGVAGPKIIKPRIDKRNFILPDATQLSNNSHSWLDRSDLVFIDPIGTGFSYVVLNKEEKESKILKKFWGFHEDLQSLSHFIRLWVTDNNRWLSPKILVGESYGGLRAGALAKYLLDKTGISPAGVVMVSPALDLWLIREHSQISLSPWLRLLPSFIHTAQYYHLGDLTPLPLFGDIEKRIETYLLQKYLPLISQGNSLSDKETESFYKDLSLLTGLKTDFVAKKKGRISFTDYAKNLFSEKRLVLSLYDSTVVYPDPLPQQGYYGRDTYLSTLSAAFHVAANHYYRDELGVNGLREFFVLNNTVNASWKYPGSSKEVEAFSDLEDGLGANPQMEAMIVHGRHDLVTPYYTSRYLILHSRIPQAQKKIRLHLYDGGHMFYLNPESLKKFDEDIRKFYLRIIESDRR